MKGKPRKRPAKGRKVELEDLRKVMVMRSFALVIEKKAYELCAADDKHSTKFQAGVKAIQTLLHTFDTINPSLSRNEYEETHGSSSNVRTHDCWDGYELCDDHVCRVWCSG